MLWTIVGLMAVVAALIVAWPIYQGEKGFSLKSAVVVSAVFVISFSVYSQIGSPDIQSAETGAAQPSVDEMVASLAQRLEQNPEDASGWKMLGRSYAQLKNFPGAIEAYERAVEIEDARDAQTLADLGEVVLLSDGRAMSGRASELFENALVVTPNNPKALFYSGMAAADRGENTLAADRWEALLATSPPENIQQVLRERIAVLRGEAPPAVTAAATSDPAPGLTISVALDETVAAKVATDATVFIIARDPLQPSPPLAAVRRRVSELPANVPLSDSDAMIPGRVPSAYSQLEIVARVSMSGQPVAQSGDWFGQAQVSTEDTDTVEIVIDEQVP